MPWPLVIHIVAGALGLLSGAVAAVAPKGGTTHRLAGRVFVGSMLVMAASGGRIAALDGVHVSVLAALLTGYLVGTGWLAGRRAAGTGTGVLHWLALLVAIGTAAYGWRLGMDARAGHADVLDGGFVVPAAVYLVFGGIAAFGAVNDAWLLVRGGAQGRVRVLQHLWRMCVALYIAASSFFTGQQDLFPESLRGSVVLQLPELLVFVLLLYSIARVVMAGRFRRRRGAPAA